MRNKLNINTFRNNRHHRRRTGNGREKFCHTFGTVWKRIRATRKRI